MITRTTLNGEAVELSHAPETVAAEVLREDLDLTGTKLACGAGVCGACTVLIDGSPCVSCLTPASALQEKYVQTIEGLAPEGLHPVQKAFLAHDALQCGYCTPGFVIEAVAFYERWRAEHGKTAPKREIIAEALSGHLCRCGAYVGIYAAVASACVGTFDDIEMVDLDYPRHEGVEKVTGGAKYTVDVIYPGMLTAKLLGSPHAHALVKKVNTSAAEAIGGVFGFIDVLSDPHRVVRYVGQPILAVAAVDGATARRALAAVEIEYEIRPFVVDPLEAAESGSPVVYPERKKQPPNASEGPIPPGRWEGNIRKPLANHLLSKKKGRAKRALAQARGGKKGLHLIENTFSTPAQTHTALEPHACVADWRDGSLTVHTSTQSVHLLGKLIAKHFDIADDRVEVRAEYIGGAFGAKQGLCLEHTTCIELAHKTGRPVKLVFDRAEEMVLGGFRPTSRIDFSLVINDEGEQCGMTSTAYGCSGTAVQSQNAPWIRFAYRGPKHCKDIDVTTNWSAAKPMRGPCGPSAFWALEQSVDQAAQTLQLDPIALRRQWDKSDVRETLYEWAEGIPEWRARTRPEEKTGRFKRGIGLAMGNWFNIYHNATRIQLDASPVGLVARCAVQDMGQGSRSVISRTIAEELGIPERALSVDIGNSTYVIGPISSGSRTTPSIYPTSIEVAQLMRERLLSGARTELGLRDVSWDAGGICHDDGHLPLDELLKQLSPFSVTSNKRGPNGPLDFPGKTPSGDLGASMVFKMTGSLCLVAVEVDTRLGRVLPTHVWMGMSVGKITNPELANSQIYGGVIQSLGLSLSEERQYDPLGGALLSRGLEDYRIPGLGDTPKIETFYDESRFTNKMKGGACGMSELSTLPVPPALGNAVYNATGWRPTDLPLTPDRVIGRI